MLIVLWTDVKVWLCKPSELLNAHDKISSEIVFGFLDEQLPPVRGGGGGGGG